MTVEPTFGPTRVDPLQRLSVGRRQRRRQPRLLVGPGRGRDRDAAEEDAAARHGLRVDRAHLPGPADARRHACPARAVKMPVLAAVMMIAVLLVILVLAAQYESLSLPMAIVLIVPMCVLAALFGVWISHFPPFAQPGRPQHLHPGGAGGAGRPGLQERDPDRRVRQGARGARRGAARCRHPRLPDAPAADPDDLDRLLRRRPAADLRQRRGQRDAPGDGHRGVLRHARRDPVRHLPDAGVLRAAARPRSGAAARRRRPPPRHGRAAAGRTAPLAAAPQGDSHA